MNKIINLKDLEELARSRLTKMAYDFIAGGAEDELTLNRNVTAWREIQLLPRVLRYANERILKTTVLGQEIEFPVLVAPMGFQRFAHPDGEIAGGQGSAAAGTIFVLSTASTCSLEEVAEGSSGPKWFQLYVYRDRLITKNLVDRAVKAGYKAICLTVDTPIEGRRERDKRNRLHLPPGISLANFRNVPSLKDIGQSQNDSALTEYIESQWETALSWEDVDWVAGLSKLPLVIKGILNARDAELAIQHGAAAIVVSNHGGRQLDGVPATADVLASVIDTVGGRCEVLVDGGILRGTDVLKALALGARAVLIGRPIFWGLTLDGANGVKEVLHHLRNELSDAMELAGCRNISEISRDLIWRSRMLLEK